MRRPAYLSQPIIQRLPNLLRDVQEGEIRIPRFQRPFIWTIDQRLLLLRSIYEGMPIGSILIWRTREHDLKSYDHLGSLRLAWSRRMEGGEKEEVRQYVLDGHQRLTTLYTALGRGLQVAESGGDDDTPREEEQEETNGTIFFDLEERVFRVQTQHVAPPLRWLPLSILLDPFQLYEFQKELLEAGIDRTLVNRAEALASTFKDYSIPVVPIVTEDLELATESFQRVNSGGTKMDEVHMVSALTWSPTFDLNERMKEIRIELGEVGWENLDEKMILNTCKAALDLDIYYAETEEIRKAIKDWPQVLLQATASLKTAARFLRDRCRVYGPATLPYSFQIVLLADAIRQGTDGQQRELSPEAAAAIARWFWLTTYTEHFAGISAVRLARTLEHLRTVATHGEAPEPPGLSREVSAPRRFDFRAARSRAIALRMADLEPRSATGDVSWDPYQVLAEHGRDAMPMLLPSRELGARPAEGPENRILVHPREASHLRRLLRDPRRCGREVLKSHAIDLTAAHSLIEGDLADFLSRRRARLLEMERSFVEDLGLKYVGD